jgi:hypothetical protein
MAIAPADWRVENRYGAPTEFWLCGFVPMYCSDGRKFECDAASSAEVDVKLGEGVPVDAVELVAHDGYTLLSVWIAENMHNSKDQINTCIVDRAPMPDTAEEAINFACFALRMLGPSLGQEG